MAPTKGTQPRQFRVADELWLVFHQAATAADSDRATILRQFMAWYVREPGAKLPKRPANSPGADHDTN